MRTLSAISKENPTKSGANFYQLTQQDNTVNSVTLKLKDHFSHLFPFFSPLSGILIVLEAAFHYSFQDAGASLSIL